MAEHWESVEKAVIEDANRRTAERFTPGTAAFIFVFALAWVFEHRTYPTRDSAYALFYGAEILTVGLGVWLSRRTAWRPHVRLVAVIATITLMILVGMYNVTVHSHTEVLTMALLYFAVGGMVLFPWGWRGQLPVAMSAVIIFVAAVNWGLQTATPLSMHVLGLTAMAILTTSGAGYLTRYRFAELQRAAELRAANAALAQANQALADANRTKNEFLANVSHELRTPLNIILGYTDLLNDGEFGALVGEAADAVERIGRTCRTLVFLISDLLDLSRIEAGHLAVRPDRVEVAHVFDEMTRFMEPRLTAKHVRFRTEAADGLAVTADRDRLEQILVNLLTNANKFTAQGEIILRARCAGDSTVAIEVADTGVGIENAELATLFEPFRQGRAGKQVGGVGIGLSLSSRLAQAMGGQLTATSQVDRGSIFVLCLPAALR